MNEVTILQLRRIMVRLGDLPHEGAEIEGGLSNGQLLSRLKEITPDSADSDESADADIEKSEPAERDG